MWGQKNEAKLIAALLVSAALLGAFFLGGDAPVSEEAPVVRAENSLPQAEVPAEETPPVDGGSYTCTVSISCASVLDNEDMLEGEKAELIPADGWVLQPVEVTFDEGESVFNVLQRVCRGREIHLEFMTTPLYGSAYVEGIHNLYEFDCGALSGWMYSVNGLFPNYGSSRYQLSDGDTVCWVYTCDLGKDVGGEYAAGKQYE